MNFIKNTYMYLTIITYIFFALAFFNISPYARKYYEDFSLCEKEFKKKDHLLIYFHSSKKENIDEILNTNTQISII